MRNFIQRKSQALTETSKLSVKLPQILFILCNPSSLIASVNLVVCKLRQLETLNPVEYDEIEVNLVGHFAASIFVCVQHIRAT